MMTRLDEVQAFVEAFEQYEWPDLLERARPFKTDPVARPKRKRKS
jgi:hypothetical protein